MKTKKFLYYIGNSFSTELLGYLNKSAPVELVEVAAGMEINPNNFAGILYTPTVNFAEEILLKSLPSEIKKIAILDLFHFDFKDYLNSFAQVPPDLVFTPRALDCPVKEFIITPSFIQSIYSSSSLPSKKSMNQNDVCFISQPLKEERSLAFNQYDLIKKFQAILSVVAPKRELIVKPHPRENLNRHLDNGYKITNETPEEILTSFFHFTGFNSALLYAAQGLNKKVCCFVNPDEISEKVVRDFLSSELPEPFNPKLSAVSILTDKLNSLIQ